MIQTKEFKKDLKLYLYFTKPNINLGQKWFTQFWSKQETINWK